MIKDNLSYTDKRMNRIEISMEKSQVYHRLAKTAVHTNVQYVHVCTDGMMRRKKLRNATPVQPGTVAHSIHSSLPCLIN
jgi:hypothetical protein